MKITLNNYVPTPCERPRLGKFGNVYSPSSNAEVALAWMMKANLIQDDDEILPLSGELIISIVIEYQKNVRGDIDNIAKFVMDASQKAGIIHNDSQYASLVISKIKGNRDATHIIITQLGKHVSIPIEVKHNLLEMSK